ncbi:MAG: hypothetical protein QG670_1050 [Thermoproteota archaeon]|nr:hypothetical protein [Thermoproteota archaeon]
MEEKSSATILTLSIMGFTFSAANLMLNPIISIYARDYAGASIQEIGLIISAFSMIAMFSKPLLGFFVTGKKILWMPILGLSLMIISPFAMTLIVTPAALIFWRLIQGLGNALIWTPLLTLIAIISSRKQLQQNISSYTTITSVGMAFGPMIGTFSNSIFGIKNTFLCASVIAIIGLLISTKVIRNRKNIFSNEGFKDSGSKFSSTDLKAVLSNKTIRLPFISYLANSFVYSILVAYGTIYAISLGINENLIPLLFVGYNVIVLATRFFLRRIMRTIDKKNLLIIALVNTVCMMVIMSFANTLVFILAFALLGFSHGIIYPLGAMFVAESIDTKNLGVANAFYTTMWDVGNFIGPAASSQVIVAANNSIPPALLFSTSLPIVGLILNFVWREKTVSKSLDKESEKGKS